MSNIVYLAFWIFVIYEAHKGSFTWPVIGHFLFFVTHDIWKLFSATLDCRIPRYTWFEYIISGDFSSINSLFVIIHWMYHGTTLHRILVILLISSQSNISLINKTSIWIVITLVCNICTLIFKLYFICKYRSVDELTTLFYVHTRSLERFSAQWMLLLIAYTCIYHDVDVKNSIGITFSHCLGCLIVMRTIPKR